MSLTGLIKSATLNTADSTAEDANPIYKQKVWRSHFSNRTKTEKQKHVDQ
jgi:hypothetical protein